MNHILFVEPDKIPVFPDSVDFINKIREYPKDTLIVVGGPLSVAVIGHRDLGLALALARVEKKAREIIERDLSLVDFMPKAEFNEQKLRDSMYEMARKTMVPFFKERETKAPKVGIRQPLSPGQRKKLKAARRRQRIARRK